MAHRFATGSQKKQQLCRLNRAPMLAADLTKILGTSTTSVAPLLTVACGDLYPGQDLVPLGSAKIRALLAKVLMEHHKEINPNLGGIQAKALMYSEMTMSVLGVEGEAKAEMKSARLKLEQILRNHLPSKSEMEVALQKLWKACMITPLDMSIRVGSVNGLDARLSMNPDATINAVKYRVWANGGHFFTPEWITDDELKNAWAQVLDVSPENANKSPDLFRVKNELLATLQLTAEPIAETWRNASIHDLCSYYETSTHHHQLDIEKESVHALFTCLAQLTKGQNKTASWISSRFRRVQEGITGLPDLDPTVVQEFSKLHANMKLSSDQIFAALAASYKCLEETPAASLCWVIEQAAASNITSALNIADTITKMQIFPLDKLIDVVIHKVQFQAVVRLAQRVIVDRFCTLLEPPVTVKEYADLAYLCLAISKRNSRGSDKNSLNEYAGEYGPYLTKNKHDLDTVALGIIEMSSGIMTKQVSMEALVRHYMPTAAGVFEFGGEDAIYLEIPTEKSDGNEEVEALPPGALPKMSLPAELRKTTKYYKKVGFENLSEILRQQESHLMRAFRNIATALSATGLQSSAFFRTSLMTQYQPPYNAVNEELKSNFNLWLGGESDEYFATHMARGINTTSADDPAIEELANLPKYSLRTLNNPVATRSAMYATLPEGGEEL